MAPTELVLTSITDVGFAPCALPRTKVKNVGNTRLTAAQGDKAQCRDFEGDKLDGTQRVRTWKADSLLVKWYRCRLTVTMWLVCRKRGGKIYR